MAIQQLIVHLLEKQADSGESKLSLRNESVQKDPLLEQFLDDLNKIYNSKSNKVYGKFESDDQQYPLSGMLSAYLQDKLDFLSLSCQAMDILKNRIDQSSKATGGYLLFVHYTQFGSEYMLIAMLNNVAGVSVNHELELNNIDYLDLSKLHLAARLDLTQWQEEPESNRYISMIRGKESHKLSDYFKTFIGCDELVDSAGETQQLLTALNDFCEHKSLEEEEKSQIKKKAVDFCTEQADSGQNIALKDFSSYVADNAVDDFLNYINNEQYHLDSEISPNKSVIRRFNKLTGRNAQMSITFSEDLLGKSIVFDQEKESLIISDLPATLKAQLLNKS